MEALGSAVGITSLGIQVCQGLLTYYNAWKDSSLDIANTRDVIVDLCDTLILLQDSLAGADLDEKRSKRVNECLEATRGRLEVLSDEVKKIQKNPNPVGLKQKTLSELHRLKFPFRKDTLTKLQDNVNQIRQQLDLALGVLHIESSQRAAALQKSNHLQMIVDWLSAPDPWTNHASARKSCQANTGEWLLRNPLYIKWKSGQLKVIWIHGKVGCGKTILSSIVVEDIRELCEHRQDTEFAIFYFSFSDDRKQKYEDMVRSLISQLGWTGPAFSMLEKAYGDPSKPGLTTSELEKILVAAINANKTTFLILDALDECPEKNDSMTVVLEGLQSLVSLSPNLRILVTSRDLGEIRDFMIDFGVVRVSIAKSDVDADIRKYVSNELANDRRLVRLDAKLKADIERIITSRSDGMFRWAFCQLQELKKLKSMRPSLVDKALRALPATLDETYARILKNIDEMYREDAVTLLRWIAYAEAPRTLGELVDAVIIDSERDLVDFDDRGNFDSPLSLLSGLIMTTGNHLQDEDSLDDYYFNRNDDSDAKLGIEDIVDSIGLDTRVRLAHFSVKEYLESNRICGPLQSFHLDVLRDNRLIARNCLTYISCYVRHEMKTGAREDLSTFPLLLYAAQSWTYHSALNQIAGVSEEVNFLSSETLRFEWQIILKEDFRTMAISGDLPDVGSALYHASSNGLHQVVKVLLGQGSDPNETFKHVGEPSLIAASQRGHCATVAVLLANPQTDVNIRQDRKTALFAAIRNGHEEISFLLIEAGAVVHSIYHDNDTALSLACGQGQESTAKLLLKKGAHVNAPGLTSNALTEAVWFGSLVITSLLITHGAIFNLCEIVGVAILNRHRELALMLLKQEVKLPTLREHLKMLRDAAHVGWTDVFSALLELGCDSSARRWAYGKLMSVADATSHPEIIKLLLSEGVDNDAGENPWETLAIFKLLEHNDEDTVAFTLARGPSTRITAHSRSMMLGLALQNKHYRVVRILLEQGVNLSATASFYGNALQTAAAVGATEMIELFFRLESDRKAQASQIRDSLSLAATGGHVETVVLLLQQGARDSGGNALYAAVKHGYPRIVALLLQCSVSNINLRRGGRRSVLQTAAKKGYREVVTILLRFQIEIDNTAILAAVSHGHEDIVTMLISKIDELANHSCLVSVTLENGQSESLQTQICQPKNLIECSKRWLCVAVKSGHLRLVSLFLKRRIDANVKDDDGNSALCLASHYGHKDIVAVLLEAGADVNYVGGTYGSALCAGAASSASSSLAIVSMLLDRGADIDGRDHFDTSPIQIAAISGNTDIVAYLCSKGAQLPSECAVPEIDVLHLTMNQEDEETALLLLQRGYAIGNASRNVMCLAVMQNAVGVVEILLKRSVTPNIIINGRSLLRVAHSVEVATLLLDYGADIEHEGDYHSSALSRVFLESQHDLISVWPEGGVHTDSMIPNGCTILQDASKRGCEDLVKLLIDRGAEVNFKAGHHGTCLHAAVSNSHVSTVAVLLEKGADVNAMVEEMGSALHVAVATGNLEVVQLLLRFRADVNIVKQDSSLRTALEFALHFRHETIALQLLECGANYERDGGRFDPLITASAQGFLKLVTRLLKHGKGADGLGDRCSQALLIVAAYGHVRVASELIHAGADVNAVREVSDTAFHLPGADVNTAREVGDTALHLAAHFGHSSMVSLLLQHKANINARMNKKLSTPLSRAVAMGHLKVVELLLDRSADIDNWENQQIDMLGLAIVYRSRGIVNKLLERGAKILDEHLSQVREHGDLDMLALLLKKRAVANGQEMVNFQACAFDMITGLKACDLDRAEYPICPGDRLDSALDAAIANWRKEEVKVLLDRGADVNGSKRLPKPLLSALKRQNTKISTLLIARGADVNARSDQLESMLEIAANNGYDHLPIVDLLIQKGVTGATFCESSGNVFQLLVERCNDVAIAMLLERGDTAFKAQEGNGGNAICTAVARGNERIFFMLLQAGVDLDERTKDHGNALCAALEKSYLRFAEIILRFSTDVNVTNRRGRNPLCMAVERGKWDMASLLLECGADPNSLAGDGYGNVLQLAAFKAKKRVVALLLKKGADVNKAGGQYGNALGAAMARGDKNIVALLRAHGAK